MPATVDGRPIDGTGTIPSVTVPTDLPLVGSPGELTFVVSERVLYFWNETDFEWQRISSGFGA